MNQQLNQQLNQRLRNAKAIKDTIYFIADVTDSCDNAITKFGCDVKGYLDEHFIVLQRLAALGVEISPEPSEYEIMLQYLHLRTGSRHYNVAKAMEDSRIYNRDVLSRIDASLSEARKLCQKA